MRNHNIDPALRERRAILELLQRVEKPDLSYAELEGLAEELSASGVQAGPVLVQEIGKTEDLDRLNKLTFLAAYLDDERVIIPLSRLLFHPNRSRAFKAQILQALERLGVDTESRFYQTVFRRREALRLNLDELRRRMPARPESAVQFLYDAFYSLPEARQMSAMLLLQNPDESSFRLLAMLAEISEEPIWRLIIDGLARIRSEDSAAALSEISRFAVLPELRQAAERGIRRLMFTGVDVPKGPSLEGIGKLQAWVGRVEGNGTRMVWLARESEPGRLDTACLLVHNSRGLVDCFGEVGAKADEFVKTHVQPQEEDGGRAAKAEYAVSLIEHALACSVSHGIPLPPEFPFRFRRLGELGLRLRLRVLAAPTTAVNAFEWGALCRLLDEPMLDDWLLNEPAFFQDVSVFFERGRYERREMERFVTRMYEEYVVSELPAMRERLLLNAEWVNECEGKSREAGLLEQAAISLAAPGPDANPFIQHYILRSIREAHEMLREGYDPTVLTDDDYFDDDE